MPELPEVETIVRQIRPLVDQRKIVHVHCDWPRVLKPSLPLARRILVERRITGLTRRGKFMVFHLDGSKHQRDAGFSPRGSSDAKGPPYTMLLHLRMSGRLSVVSRAAPRDRHVHFALDFTDGTQLRFADARKFGRVVVTRSPDLVLRRIGPEPLDSGFTPERLAILLKSRSRRLKPLLLDQSALAGLGNIYTDECLFRAGLHPMRRSDRLRPAQIARLHRAIRDALLDGIARMGASIDWVYPGGEMQEHFLAYGRKGQCCRRCGATIRRIVVGQRGTFFCPRCQRPPRSGG
jgi:formamidopyrimidine-DNA glycosylase